MNRIQRRALARTASKSIADRGEREQRSNKLPRQVCALWAPDVSGYIANFRERAFNVVPFIELAQHYQEDEAARVAIRFKEITGLRVTVRPVHCHNLH